MKVLPLFCEIDDFCKVFEKLYQRRALGNKKQTKPCDAFKFVGSNDDSRALSRLGLSKPESVLFGENRTSSSVGVSRSVQLPQVCTVAIESGHAIVFLPGFEARRLRRHLVH